LRSRCGPLLLISPQLRESPCCGAISLQPRLEIARSGALYGLVGDCQITIEQLPRQKKSPEAFRAILVASPPSLAQAVHSYTFSRAQLSHTAVKCDLLASWKCHYAHIPNND
jgi:hypothetical protein